MPSSAAPRRCTPQSGSRRSASPWRRSSDRGTLAGGARYAARERPGDVRIEVIETVISGTRELLEAARVDLAIGPEANGNPRHSPLADSAWSPWRPSHRVASATLGRALTDRDVKRHRRIFMRETSVQRTPEVEGVSLRRTVSNKATQIRAPLPMGLGWAWMPEETILPESPRAGQLKPAARLQPGAHRTAHMHVAFADPELPRLTTPRGSRKSSARACTSPGREEQESAMPLFRGRPREARAK